jgi:hypothetical protein
VVPNKGSKARATNGEKENIGSDGITAAQEKRQRTWRTAQSADINVWHLMNAVVSPSVLVDATVVVGAATVAVVMVSDIAGANTLAVVANASVVSVANALAVVARALVVLFESVLTAVIEASVVLVVDALT